jgi:hypothetical protein
MPVNPVQKALTLRSLKKLNSNCAPVNVDLKPNPKNVDLFN